jgi:LysR family nitrogen assimilation transcriptional regulator
VDHAGAVAGIELTVAVETNAMSIQRSLAAGGHGLTILPPIAVADEVASKRLSAAPVSDPKITRTITLALPASRVNSRPVRCVVDLLVQCMKEAVERKAWMQGRWLG